MQLQVPSGRLWARCGRLFRADPCPLRWRGLIRWMSSETRVPIAGSGALELCWAWLVLGKFPGDESSMRRPRPELQESWFGTPAISDGDQFSSVVFCSRFRRVTGSIGPVPVLISSEHSIPARHSRQKTHSSSHHVDLWRALQGHHVRSLLWLYLLYLYVTCIHD